MNNQNYLLDPWRLFRK